MPELAAFFAVGCLVCIALGGLLLTLSLRRLNSPRAQILQGNLKTLGLHWSEQGDALQAWQPDAFVAERARAVRTIGLTASLFVLGSWLGAFGMLVLMLSIRFLARSRLERALFASELARDASLSPERARALVAEIAEGTRTRLPEGFSP